MSLKPQPPRPMPAEMAVLGAKLLPAASPYRLVGDQLYDQYHEADYADLYPAEGQPALSPVDLSLVTVFQALEDQSDRQAAESVRLRLDWKYALHLPLDYAGFNFSVLSEFRDRVRQHQAEARVFETVLGQLQDLGLLKRRGRQRTDSTAVLTKVRQLNRLELVVETLRLAVRALLAADPAWTRATVPPTWEERYGTRCVAERLSDQEQAELQAAVGPDGQWLLDRLAAPATPPALAALPEVQTLRTVWAQQYEVRAREVIFREPGPYDGTTRIQSPHDPEARYSEKRGQGWVGDKLQVTETDDDDLPHLITDIALTSSVESDQAALGPIQARQAARDVAPGERVADQGYVSGETLTNSDRVGEDLLGPAPADRCVSERGQVFVGPRPEGIETFAARQHRRAERKHMFRAGPAPAHPGARHPRLELFGRTFHHPTTNRPALLAQLLILHAITVVAEIRRGFLQRRGPFWVRAQRGHLVQIPRDLPRVAQIERLFIEVVPLGGRGTPFRVQQQFRLAQVFGGVVPIHRCQTAVKVFLVQIPNPRSAIAEHLRVGGLLPAPALCFRPQLPTEDFRPSQMCHITGPHRVPKLPHIAGAWVKPRLLGDFIHAPQLEFLPPLIPEVHHCPIQGYPQAYRLRRPLPRRTPRPRCRTLFRFLAR